ncbi:hypothetical protein CONCODRAFT_15545 [Conidiobolus coronatus NRRL 28638]|uniref:Proteinase inhibitor I78 n=1 Tax=Conidiobolus coronatus (strain ATCC 28846 / CBS 209.66 / NRRL 28638) TaxID=796925 RepID=A0A137PEH7_CONC2|nr:hypothetical protein CONCODRAFT_15545 [Conidiobolus coronatus NRRL 28638]|eukprot:KXN73414.1 hypothetical protein CONCODRAFT_15545 [Conidiobolus coronatus NRRL 28638]
MVSADNYQNLVGKTLIKAGQESSVQKTDNHVLESELPKPSRVEEPGSMYTFDFVEERLRVKVDENGVIKSVMNG